MYLLALSVKNSPAETWDYCCLKGSQTNGETAYSEVYLLQMSKTHFCCFYAGLFFFFPLKCNVFQLSFVRANQ